MEMMQTIVVSGMKVSTIEKKINSELHNFLAQNPNAEIKNFQQSYDNGVLIITIWYRDKY